MDWEQTKLNGLGTKKTGTERKCQSHALLTSHWASNLKEIRGLFAIKEIRGLLAIKEIRGLLQNLLISLVTVLKKKTNSSFIGSLRIRSSRRLTFMSLAAMRAVSSQRVSDLVSFTSFAILQKNGNFIFGNSTEKKNSTLHFPNRK